MSGSDNIATRVRAKNAKARQKEIHKIHNILRLGIEITRLFLSHFHTNINPKGSSFTMDVDLVEVVDNSI